VVVDPPSTEVDGRGMV